LHVSSLIFFERIRGFTLMIPLVPISLLTGGRRPLFSFFHTLPYHSLLLIHLHVVFLGHFFNSVQWVLHICIDCKT
jgi:hypothetical protein